MTHSKEWGLRSMQDDPDSDSWGGQNVFDVYTKVARHRAGRHKIQGLVDAAQGTEIETNCGAALREGHAPSAFADSRQALADSRCSS